MLQDIQKVRTVLLLSDESDWEIRYLPLSDFGYNFIICRDDRDIFFYLLNTDFDIICLSVSFLVRNGLSFFDTVISHCRMIPVLVIADEEDIPLATWAIHHGAEQYIVNTGGCSGIARQLDRYCRLYPLKGKCGMTFEFAPFDAFIGQTPEIIRMKKTAAKYAVSNAPVLIEGESGTGKTMLAQQIHNVSKRSGKKFLAENMAVIPESLAESTLFGTKKGAFTDAADRPGLFEMADGGSLFLDEISETALSVQAKLLRVLGQRKIHRVGEFSEKNVDVRLIAATNRNLRQAVAGGFFRADLYYRLSVLTVKLPPLREHLTDIPLLVQSMMQDYDKSISRGAVEKLFSHTWPGNVRELHGCLQRAACICETDTITESDIEFLPVC